MTRFLAILFALTCAASAQTYRTVTADTNNVIRTNFTLGAGQISGTFAISNVTGLQSALDGKLATNGSAAGLTNFPALVLTTNSSASAFPAALLRTNGDGSGLTNLPNANLSNAVGVLPLSNGGTGATNASNARTALELGTAATNDATAFQPASSALTNLAANNAANLTNFPAKLLRTNGNAAFLTNFPADLLRTNGDASGLTGLAVFPSYTNNAQKVLAVTTNETGVEWVAVSNTVTDASTLTNFPASVLQTGSAETDFPAFLVRTNGDGAGLTNLTAANVIGTVALASNVTGTVALASNVTGVVAVTNGGTGAGNAASARVNLLPDYSGNAGKILAVNSNATDVVWQTDAGGSVDLTNATGVLAISNGGTGANGVTNALTNLTILRSNNTVAIGTSVDTKGVSNAVIIGALAKTDFTNDHNSVAIGYAAEVRGTNSIAIGNAAIAEFNNTIQIGIGSAQGSSVVQFFSWGLVHSNEWAALANAGSIGTNLLRSTNIAGAQSAMFTATTTNAPTNTNAPTPTAWLNIRVGTNDYKLPLWQ